MSDSIITQAELDELRDFAREPPLSTCIPNDRLNAMLDVIAAQRAALLDMLRWVDSGKARDALALVKE